MSGLLVYFALLGAPMAQAQISRCTITPGWVDAHQAEDLLKQARYGDREAQFQLGLRYELGIGRPKNLHEAKQMYDRAAAGPPKRRQIYSPAVPGERYGRILTVENRAVALPHARAALRSSCLLVSGVFQ